MTVKVGDWVCFQQLGVPVYGIVLYVIPFPHHVEGDKVVTSCGEVSMQYILEVRPPQET